MQFGNTRNIRIITPQSAANKAVSTLANIEREAIALRHFFDGYHFNDLGLDKEKHEIVNLALLDILYAVREARQVFNENAS